MVNFVLGYRPPPPPVTNLSVEQRASRQLINKKYIVQTRTLADLQEFGLFLELAITRFIFELEAQNFAW